MNWVRASVLALAAALTCVSHTAFAGDEPYRATVSSDSVQHVSILGGSYFFKPAHIIVKANVPVELSVVMAPGIIPHSFVLKASDAGIAINADLSADPKKITFTPVVPGKYPFYCSHKLLFFKSHRDRGMEGILEVVE